MKAGAKIGTLVVIKDKYKVRKLHITPLSALDLEKFPQNADRIYRVLEHPSYSNPGCLFVEDAIDTSREIFGGYKNVYIDPVFLKPLLKGDSDSEYGVGDVVVIKPEYHGKLTKFPGKKKKDKYVLDLDQYPTLSGCKFEIVGVKDFHYEVKRTDCQKIWGGHKVCHFHKDAVTK